MLGKGIETHREATNRSGYVKCGKEKTCRECDGKGKCRTDRNETERNGMAPLRDGMALNGPDTRRSAMEQSGRAMNSYGAESPVNAERWHRQNILNQEENKVGKFKLKDKVRYYSKVLNTTIYGTIRANCDGKFVIVTLDKLLVINGNVVYRCFLPSSQIELVNDEDKPEKEPEPFGINCKAVYIAEDDIFYFTRGKIYEFSDGRCVDDIGNYFPPKDFEKIIKLDVPWITERFVKIVGDTGNE